MIKQFSIFIIIFLSFSSLADELLLNEIKTAFQQSYEFEEAAFDDTARKVSYSKGFFSFSNSVYKIVIEEPLAEEYQLSKEGLNVIDHEFNQQDFIPIGEIDNPFISILLFDEVELSNVIITSTDNTHLIDNLNDMQPIEITLIDNKIELIRYVDHANVTHIINFL